MDNKNEVSHGQRMDLLILEGKGQNKPCGVEIKLELSI